MSYDTYHLEPKSVVRSPERSFCLGSLGLGALGGHRGHLHKVRKVYGDPKGSLDSFIRGLGSEWGVFGEQKGS